MALFISFGVSKPGFKRFTLFAQGKVPVWTFSFGFMSILHFGYPFMRAFSDFADGNCRWESLLAEHTESLRLHRRKVMAKARKEAEGRTAEQVEYWKEAYYGQRDDAQKTRQENYRLHQAVEALAAKLSGKGEAA